MSGVKLCQNRCADHSCDDTEEEDGLKLKISGSPATILTQWGSPTAGPYQPGHKEATPALTAFRIVGKKNNPTLNLYTKNY